MTDASSRRSAIDSDGMAVAEQAPSDRSFNPRSRFRPGRNCGHLGPDRVGVRGGGDGLGVVEAGGGAVEPHPRGGKVCG